MKYPETHQLQYLRNIVFAVLCFLSLAGCATKRDNYNVPALSLPKTYAKAPMVVDTLKPKNPTTHSSATTPASASSLLLSTVLAEWWHLLGSSELDGLMDRALANNPDLRIATLRIAQSKARLDQAGADKAPTITMPVQAKTIYPEFGIGRGNSNGNNSSRAINQISIKGDWRPDIWGEAYSLYESSELQLLRATFQRDDIQRNVVTDVVVNYMEYLTLNDRLRVAQDTEKSFREMLASVNARLEMGDATITDMEQQKAAVYQIKATIPVLEQQREVVLNRIASLLGSVPVAMKLSDGGLDTTTFPLVLPGVPSALLLRRPDVRAVEAQLLAADADIDIARAQVLPPLDLTAQIGYGSAHLSQLFMPQTLFWNLIANLTVTLFDSDKRANEVKFAQSVHEELVETYVRVIYDAVREVDNSLSAIRFMEKRLEAQGVATHSALRAWHFSQEALMAGAVDYLVVLDTQRTHQRNLDDWYSARMERYRGLINLFSALGGGVPSGSVIPGEGERPASLVDESDYGVVLAETKGATQAEIDAAKKQPNNKLRSNAAKVDVASSRKVQVEGVDWAGNALRGNTTPWLVALIGVYDHGAVLPAWRDLHARFPQQIKRRTLLPYRQGLVNAADQERASWYRLYIATFSDKKEAEEFCAILSAGQQRCEAVSSQSLEGEGDFVAPSVSAPSVGITAGVVSVEAEQQDMKVVEAEVMPVTIAVPEPMLVEVPESTPTFAAIPSGNKDGSGQQRWLVELFDSHFRRAISSVRLDLLNRFPTQLKNRTILPRLQAIASDAGENRPSRYQIFIANFTKKQEAEAFCALLRENRQLCGVVPSQSLAQRDALDTSSVIDKNGSVQDIPDQDASAQNVERGKP